MANSRTEFDAWLSDRYRSGGDFTVLIVLVAIGDVSVDLLRSAFLHVIGDEVAWDDIAKLFASAGVDWNGVAFFEAAPAGGLVPDADARERLTELVARLNGDRLVLNESMFVDRLGRRLQIEELTAH